MKGYLGVYSVFDTAVSVFGTPFFAPTEASAIRSFVTLANDVNSTVHMYPQDFSLYYLGSYDSETGTIVSEPPFRLNTPFDPSTSAGASDE